MSSSHFRGLKYATFISGDGNFHQQLRHGAKDLDQDPSFYGDSAFFVPEQKYQDYLGEAERLQHRLKAGP